MSDFKTQVNKDHYSTKTYLSIERFVSYFYQINSVLSLKKKEILEIGPGNKIVSSALCQNGMNVTTCDIDDKLKPDLIADVRSLPIKDGSYDIVMACQILEHIPFDDFEKALSELKRVAKDYVVISLPRRCSCVEFVIKLPLIRSFFKRKFIDLSLVKSLKFKGFEESGQHYWEIDRSVYKLGMIRKFISKHFKIIDEFSPVLNKYHYFFILKKND